jgi:hypothetical protein
MTFFSKCKISHAVKMIYIIKVFYSPTDAQENRSKKTAKIYIKRAPTCFGAITIIREGILKLAKVTVAKIINQNTSVWLIR